MTTHRVLCAVCFVPAYGLPGAEYCLEEVNQNEEPDTHETQKRYPSVHVEVVNAHPGIGYIVAKPLRCAVCLGNKEHGDSCGESYA